MDSNINNKTIYKELLKDYVLTQDKTVLKSAGQVTKYFIQNNILPEEIVKLHIQTIAELCPTVYEDIQHWCDFLMEAMVSYGLALEENAILREKQFELKSEIAIAADMQKTLLATMVPKIDDLEIGVISVPARQMSGDYYHFVTGKDGTIGIALADVIGKGIPAALCMSMIKYAMDGFSEQSMSPKEVLERLNHVIELNVDSSMFITMFYAKYIIKESRLVYASAGHEPGFLYHEKTKSFQEIYTKGIVLGVSAEVEYPQYELYLNEGDMVILLTDGVTECRQGERFIEREELLDAIKRYMHLSAQEIVNHVYHYFEHQQGFQLKDDFTLILLRKGMGK